MCYFELLSSLSLSLLLICYWFCGTCCFRLLGWSKVETQSEEQRLKYLEFVQVAALHAILCAAKVYSYAKENLGPLKPGVQTVEGTVKTVVGPVYDKVHNVPGEVLKFVDRKVF